MSRPRHSRGLKPWQSVQLLSSNNSSMGVRSVGEVAELVDAGRVEWLHHGDAQQMAVARFCLVASLGSDSQPTAATIKKSEMEANAGFGFPDCGSRTAGMTDAARLERLLQRNLPQEDFAELAHAKVEAWPYACDRLAPRVGPAPA